MADDAGPLLTRAGLIENEQLLIARQAQTALGGTVGEHLVLKGFIADEELTLFYRTRLMVPRVDPAQLEQIAPTVLRRIPKDMAVEFRLVPVAIDRDQNLIVAMSDPSNTHAVDEISFFTSTYVVRAVASQREIALALKTHYGFESPLLNAPVAGLAAATDVQRRRAMPPMTSPPSEAQRAFRVSEIVPAIRDAKQAEAAAMFRGRAGMPAAGGPPPPAPEPAAPHDRKTQQQPAVGRDRSEEDTRPIMRAVDIQRVRRSSEAPKVAAGEVSTATSGDRELSERLPAVVVAVDALTELDAAPAVPVATPQAKTIIEPVPADASEEPILLQQRTARPSGPPPAAPPVAAAPASKTQVGTAVPEPVDDAGSDDVVVLSNVKGKTRRRRASATRLGIGAHGASASKIPGLKTITPEVSDGTPTPVPAEQTPGKVSNKTQQLTAVREDEPLESEQSAVPAPTTRASSAPPHTRTRARKRTSNRAVESPPTTTSKTMQIETVAEQPPPADDDKTLPRVEAVPAETELEQTGKFDRSDSTLMAAIDDGWGEPGSTIPPPFLGAVEDEVSSPMGIPVPDPESTEPEVVAIAAPPQDDASEDMDLPSHKQPAAIRSEQASVERGAASYDAAVRRLSSTMKRLEEASNRDEVISELVSFLGAVCKRAAFFAVKRGELHGWSAAGQGVVSKDVDQAHLPLDRPSTFQDIVATRMPFHGPLHDAVSRDFLLGAVGATPTDMTALPITVRDKVVGILYGDDRRQVVFDDHLTTLSRSAGAAIERILVARKARPSS